MINIYHTYKYGWKESALTEISAMVQTFFIYAIQCGSHQSHVAIDTCVTEELKFKFYLLLIGLTINLNKHIHALKLEGP